MLNLESRKLRYGDTVSSVFLLVITTWTCVKYSAAFIRASKLYVPKSHLWIFTFRAWLRDDCPRLSILGIERLDHWTLITELRRKRMGSTSSSCRCWPLVYYTIVRGSVHRSLKRLLSLFLPQSVHWIHPCDGPHRSSKPPQSLQNTSVPTKAILILHGFRDS